jgi:hypothetical protein
MQFIGSLTIAGFSAFFVIKFISAMTNSFVFEDYKANFCYAVVAFIVFMFAIVLFVDFAKKAINSGK